VIRVGRIFIQVNIGQPIFLFLLSSKLLYWLTPQAWPYSWVRICSQSRISCGLVVFILSVSLCLLYSSFSYSMCFSRLNIHGAAQHPLKFIAGLCNQTGQLHIQSSTPTSAPRIASRGAVLASNIKLGCMIGSCLCIVNFLKNELVLLFLQKSQNTPGFSNCKHVL
jgi:hypothetical protein